MTGRRTNAAPWALALVLSACSTPMEPASSLDASVVCTNDRECDDGRYCNGTEHCQGDGGVGFCAAGTPACSGVCDEFGDRCGTPCHDRDGDGATDVACGGTDCDDRDANRHPAGAEVCDAGGHDEDCDPTTFGARDLDHDGALDVNCCNHADGVDHCGSDCDDSHAYVNPTNPELCDERDNDCDGAIDEMVVPVPWYRDADGDLAGDASNSVASCRPVPGHVLDSRDCDDGNVAVSPLATETCDGVDDDCDAMVDEGLGPDINVRCTLDSAFGVCADGLTRCDGSGGIRCVAAGAAGPETCDGEDDDCDGAIDEDVDRVGEACTAAGAFGLCAHGSLRCRGAMGYVCQPSPPQTELCTLANENCDAAERPYDGLACIPGATTTCEYCTTPFVQGQTTCSSVCELAACAPPVVDLVFDATNMTPVAPTRGGPSGTTWVVPFSAIYPASFSDLYNDVLEAHVNLPPGSYRVTSLARWDATHATLDPLFGADAHGEGSAASIGVHFYGAGAVGAEATRSDTFVLQQCATFRVSWWSRTQTAGDTGSVTLRSIRLTREGD